jgi:hypothetical protein
VSNRQLDHISRRVLMEFDPFIYERPASPMPDISATSTAIKFLIDLGLLTRESGRSVLTPAGRQKIAELKRSWIDKPYRR